MSTARSARHLMRTANPLAPDTFANYVDSPAFQRTLDAILGSDGSSPLASVTMHGDAPLDDRMSSNQIESIGIDSLVPDRFRARRHVGLLAAAAVVLTIIAVVVTALSVAQHGRTSGPPATEPTSPSPVVVAGPPAATRAKLWQIVLDESTWNGYPQVKSAQAVLATMGEFDPGVPVADRAKPIWLIEVNGLMCACSAMPGTVPHTNSLLLTVDRATLTQSGYRIVGQTRDLAALGPVITLTPVSSLPAVPATGPVCPAAEVINVAALRAESSQAPGTPAPDVSNYGGTWTTDDPRNAVIQVSDIQAKAAGLYSLVEGAKPNDRIVAAFEFADIVPDGVGMSVPLGMDMSKRPHWAMYISAQDITSKRPAFGGEMAASCIDG
jgi:hypothetical protein